MLAPQELSSVAGSLSDRLQTIWHEALRIWSSGGWAMWAIALIAFVMFAMGVHIQLALWKKGTRGVPEEVWRGWIDRPEEREGPVGRLLHRLRGNRTLKELTHAFEQLRHTECVPFERDLRVMKTCVSAAPLVGLLGTVTGMLATFSALSSGSGGDKTMAMIAEGISEALITTETGLVIALPGLFFQYQLSRSFERYKAFLAHLETVCTQKLFHSRSDENQIAARRIAKARIAGSLRTRLAERMRNPSPQSPPVVTLDSNEALQGLEV